MTKEMLEKAEAIQKEITEIEKTVNALKYALRNKTHRSKSLFSKFCLWKNANRKITLTGTCGSEGFNFSFDFYFDREAAETMLLHYQERLQKNQEAFDSLGAEITP